MKVSLKMSPSASIRLISLMMVLSIGFGKPPRNVLATTFRPIEVPNQSGSLIPPYALPKDVSPNGLRVVGNLIDPGLIYRCESSLGCTSSFSWDKETGTTIGNVSGFPASRSTASGEREINAASMVAATNKTVLAHADISGTYVGPLLLSDDGPVLLYDSSQGQLYLHATAVSDNGQVVVGANGSILTSNFRSRGFRWTEEEGFEFLGDIYPSGLSGDGTTIIGFSSSNYPSDNTHLQGFRWKENQGFLSLPEGPNGEGFRPEAISSDGSVIVGGGNKLTINRPLIWTDEMGTQALATLSGYNVGKISDTDASGRLLVGTSSNWVLSDGIFVSQVQAELIKNSRATLWNQNRQAFDLKQWLSNYSDLSLQLEGWVLSSADAISADGKVIAGLGINPNGNIQGWVASIPESSTLTMCILSAVLLTLRCWAQGSGICRIPRGKLPQKRT